MKEKRIKPF
jgi:hypothetical protein